MSYQSTHIQIMDMTFSKDVSIAEFEQWLTEVENFCIINKILHW